MSIWNKILLGLVGVASLVFFHAAARTVKTYKHWSEKAATFEAKLAEKHKEIVRLRTADHEHPLEDKTIGVQQLRIDLGRVLANRGRIWTKCEKKSAGPDKTGLMAVTVGTDDANAFATNMLVYAFEEGDDQSPGKYLGEFRVAGIGTNKNEVALTSTTQMVGSLAKNVTESKSKSGWVLYETMPSDEHEAFANMPEEQRKWVKEEFVKDGQDVDGKKFERQLRDYLAIFRACEVHRTLYVDRFESAKRDLDYLETAGKDAEILQAMAEKEKAQVTKENQRAKIELGVVNNLYAARQNMLKLFQASVQAAVENNRKLAQEIARLQKEAADLIDRRTRNLAQSGPGAD